MCSSVKSCVPLSELRLRRRPPIQNVVPQALVVLLHQLAELLLAALSFVVARITETRRSTLPNLVMEKTRPLRSPPALSRQPLSLVAVVATTTTTIPASMRGVGVEGYFRCRAQNCCKNMRKLVSILIAKHRNPEIAKKKSRHASLEGLLRRHLMRPSPARTNAQRCGLRLEGWESRALEIFMSSALCATTTVRSECTLPPLRRLVGENYT